MAKAESESQLLSRIRLALGQDARAVLWRNNAGKFLADFGAAGTRPVSTGLTVGASDLVGMVKVLGMHVDDMHQFASPATLARFLAIEVKSHTGRIRLEQVQFARLVNSLGGYACVVRSVADAIDAVDRAARGESAPEVK